MLRHHMKRQDGIAMILAILLGTSLIFLSALSVQQTLVQSVTRTVQQDVFIARQIANSAAAHALARIKESGIVAPFSGSGVAPSWVSFSDGSYFYYSTFNAALQVNVIRAWGRVASDPNAVASTVSPDDPNWDASGWTMQGVEITVKGYKYLPESPLYFGNGGIERPATSESN